jgi:hypothetical protein
LRAFRLTVAEAAGQTLFEMDLSVTVSHPTGVERY